MSIHQPHDTYLTDLLKALNHHEGIEEKLRTLLIYFLNQGDISDEVVQESFEKGLAKRGEEFFMTAAERIMKKGGKKGEIKGEINLLNNLYQRGNITEEVYQEMLIPQKKSLEEMEKSIK